MNINSQANATVQSSEVGEASLLGQILVDRLGMASQNVAKVLVEQGKSGRKFGEIAVKNRYISALDLQMALALQYAYPQLVPGGSSVSPAVISAYDPNSLFSEAIKEVRSNLLLEYSKEGRLASPIAILSANRRDGRSFIAASLAVAFSQSGRKTLLIDADLRNPIQHRLFGIPNPPGLADFLADRVSVSPVYSVSGLGDLDVMPGGVVVPNPQELISSSKLGVLIKVLAGAYDAIILDTSAFGLCGDAGLVAAQSTGGLIVARRNKTDVRMMETFQNKLRKVGVRFAGAVMNSY